MLPYAIVVLFAYIGFSLPLPILPALFLDAENSIVAGFTLQEKMLALGLVMASFPCGQFFGSPIIGHLSDRYGRKKVILYSLCGTTIGYLITAYSVSQHYLSTLFLGLALCGFCEGNVTIGQSVVVDTASTPESKARHFGLLNAFISLGFIVGPLMGGQLADPSVVSWFNFSTPFWVASCMTLLGICVIYFCSTETLQRKKEGNWDFFSSIAKELKRPKLPKLYLANLFLALGYFSFFRFLPVYLKDQFDFSPSYLSFVMVYGSFAMILGILCLVPVLAKTFSSISILSVFSAIFATLLLICIWPSTPFAVWLTIPLLGVCLAVTITNGSLIISNATSGELQGQALGTLTSVQVLAEALTGIFGGMFAAEQSALPLVVGAATSLLCTAVILINKRSLYV